MREADRTMRDHFVSTVLVGAVLALLSTSSFAASAIATEHFMVPSQDAGIELYVRNKHLVNQNRFAADRIILFVHGATFPSETGFDVDLPGGSWLDFVARRGFDVYAVDVRGYGRSTRPPAMEQPPAANPPLASTRDAQRDVGSAVDFILKRRKVSKVNLLGWSWGTTTMAGFASENPDKVNRLVLFAPVWAPVRTPPEYEGAYRLSTYDSARAQNTNGIPKDRLEEISPKAWFDEWWAENLASDPTSASRNPPSIRSPNGVMKDFAEFWAMGKPTYDPLAIRAPTLVIVGGWDATTPPAMAQELFKQLTNARDRRVVVMSEGSHSMSLEKNRLRLFREVQHFLEEPEE
jgi:pimeloyl-ACP methyl ester carboxylesterase